MGKLSKPTITTLSRRMSLWLMMVFLGSAIAMAKVTGTVVDENEDPCLVFRSLSRDLRKV